MSKMLSTLNLFCLTQCPQNGCLYERCSQCAPEKPVLLNVKMHPKWMPVLLKQNAPEMDAFQQRLLNSQRETYVFVET